MLAAEQPVGAERAAVCVSNPDCSPFGIYGRNPAHTPSGFLEIISYDFPVLHCITSIFITG
jgi:hypothetical protein